MPFQHDDAPIKSAKTLIKQQKETAKTFKPLLDKIGGAGATVDKIMKSGLTKDQVQQILDAHKQNQATVNQVENLRQDFQRSISAALTRRRKRLKDASNELEAGYKQVRDSFPDDNQDLVSDAVEAALKKALTQMH